VEVCCGESMVLGIMGSGFRNNADLLPKSISWILSNCLEQWGVLVWWILGSCHNDSNVLFEVHKWRGHWRRLEMSWFHQLISNLFLHWIALFEVGIGMQTCWSLLQKAWQSTWGDEFIHGSWELISRMAIKSESTSDDTWETILKGWRHDNNNFELSQESYYLFVTI
jgi:hypothetical protein